MSHTALHVAVKFTLRFCSQQMGDCANDDGYIDFDEVYEGDDLKMPSIDAPYPITLQ